MNDRYPTIINIMPSSLISSFILKGLYRLVIKGNNTLLMGTSCFLNRIIAVAKHTIVVIGLNISRIAIYPPRLML